MFLRGAFVRRLIAVRMPWEQSATFERPLCIPVPWAACVG